MIRHLILFTFESEATTKQIQAVADKFCNMKISVPGVHEVIWGKNNSTKGKNQGYDYCLQMDFIDDDARAFYNQHAEHQAVKALQKGIVEQKLVFDYNL